MSSPAPIKQPPFPIQPRTILLTLAGSRAYGLDTPTSDVDLKGVVIPPTSFYLGKKNFTHWDGPDLFQDLIPTLHDRLRIPAEEYGCEGIVYDVNRFLNLACTANSTIMASPIRKIGVA